MEKCNCENSNCEHTPGECGNEGKIRFEYVGRVCYDCANSLPKDHMLELPPLGTLMLHKGLGQFGVVHEIRAGNIICNGYPGCGFLGQFWIHKHEFDEMVIEPETTSVYDFQVAVGENVYDPYGWAETSRVLEVHKRAVSEHDEDCRIRLGICCPVYDCVMFNFESRFVHQLTVYRRQSGTLYWVKHA